MNDATEIVVGANGRVLVAASDPLGSGDFPTDVVVGSGDALDPSVWTEVGFVSENGVTFTDGKTIADIPAWQAFYPVRKIVTDKMTKVEFVMRQWNTETVRFAFGGGDVDVSSGVALYTPPAPGDLDNRAMVVEWTDGPDMYRLVLPRGIVTGDVAAQVVRTAASDLPVSFEVSPAGLPVEGNLASQPWYIVTDADQFASGS